MTKTLFTAVAASLLLAGAASAQTAAPANGAAAPAPAARPTINSSIEALVNNAETKAVLTRHLPGVDAHPAYGQFKRMTLREVAPFSQGLVTDQLIAAIDADLKALPEA